MSTIAYVPKHFAESDRDALLAFIRERTFGTFVTIVHGEPLMAHAPVVVEEGALRFHLAKANPILAAVRSGAAATAIFQGADGYISPDWYGIEDQVPTWNYVAVYVRGTMRSLSRAEMIAQADALSSGQETRLAPKKPWTRAKMSRGADERMFAAIEGVELSIDAIDGKFKLSQNKPACAVLGAASALEARGRTALAAAMRAAQNK
jgi:transcriptional regulator